MVMNDQSFLIFGLGAEKSRQKDEEIAKILR